MSRAAKTAGVAWLVTAVYYFYQYALGFISDRIGRRKPVIVVSGLVLFACLAWILFGRANVLPPYLLGLVAGVASGGVNFLNFTFSALLTPVFGRALVNVSGGIPQMRLEHYQTAFAPLLIGVALAILLTLFLEETGPAMKMPRPATPARRP